MVSRSTGMQLNEIVTYLAPSRVDCAPLLSIIEPVRTEPKRGAQPYMTTTTATATMTAEERLAAEAFRADLLAEFREVTDVLRGIKGTGTINHLRGEVRHLYREIKEVEYCLATNVLPF